MTKTTLQLQGQMAGGNHPCLFPKQARAQMPLTLQALGNLEDLIALSAVH